MGAYEQLYVVSRQGVITYFMLKPLINFLYLAFTAKQDWHYDFSRCLEKLNPLEIKPKAVLQSEKIKSCRKLIYSSWYVIRLINILKCLRVSHLAHHKGMWAKSYRHSL